MAEGSASKPIKARLRNYSEYGRIAPESPGAKAQAAREAGKTKNTEAEVQAVGRKRRSAVTTEAQQSMSTMEHLEKPSAPSKPVKPQKPWGTKVTIEWSSYSKVQAEAPKKASPEKRKMEDFEQNIEAGSGPKKQKAKSKYEEKRLRVFRKKVPLSYLEKLERATSQRMFVIERNRGGTEEVPEETIEMAGTTGNIYSITIAHEPKCTCPDNQKGNQCKHIVYVLHQVLKAPENLQYQLAFLSSELREIFANAPFPLSEADTSISNNRKEVSGDCPICFTEFEPETEEIVWCKAACGNNIHQGCFEQWAMSHQKGKEVKCVYCRTPWQGDPESLARIKSSGRMNEEGYVNVGEQLGLSGVRDYSSYHQPWEDTGSSITADEPYMELADGAQVRLFTWRHESDNAPDRLVGLHPGKTLSIIEEDGMKSIGKFLEEVKEDRETQMVNKKQELEAAKSQTTACPGESKVPE